MAQKLRRQAGRQAGKTDCLGGRPAREAFALKLGLAVAALGLVGWNSNTVGVDVTHIAQWNPGTVDEPILVNRDNPWLQGWFNTTAGNSWNGIGQYSHQYSGTCNGTIRTYEFWSPPFNTDDWATPMRPVAGYQYTDSRASQLNWAVRSGNLVPENSYAVAQAHLCNNDGLATSPSATWFQLSPSVLVVPVVLVSWIRPGLEWPPAEQDFRARGRALFDFIPFKGSYTNTAPSQWNAANTAAPEPYYDPPDDIWTQCGIQFQVVAEFKFDAQKVPPPCNKTGNVQEFAEVGAVKNLIAGQIGAGAAEELLTLLAPVRAHFGYLGCSNFRGKGDLGDTHSLHIDRADSGPAPLVAHELGHVLGLTHVGTSTNLMCGQENCTGRTITQQQCNAARTRAGEFASRFREYNRKLGRIPASNPITVYYPDPHIVDPSLVSFPFTCCEVFGSKYWASVASCPGTVLPDAACTECCTLSESPVDVEFVRLGSCGGTILEASKCTSVCCSNGGSFQLVAQAECFAAGGTPIDREYCL